MKTNEFLEKEARDNLGLVKKGETVAILPSESRHGRNEAQQGENQGISNWKRWWRLFF